MATSPPKNIDEAEFDAWFEKEFAEFDPEMVAEYKRALDNYAEKFYQLMLSHARQKPEYHPPQALAKGEEKS
jgi:hypothetical protein